MDLNPKTVFATLPSGLAADLLDAFYEVVTNFEQHRWEPSELNGGKLCEAAYTIVDGFLKGVYAPRAQKPSRLPDQCWKLCNTYPQGAHSARITIPRMIIALYEIRNNRGVGHAGGDVDPNEMDATAVLYMSKWIVAELVRLLHTLSTTAATDLVEDIVERQISFVWRHGNRKRVLVPGLRYKDQVLLLLAGTTKATEDELVGWLEHTNVQNFRSQIARPMHKERLIDYNESERTMRLLPPGILCAEALVRKLS